MDRAKLDLFKTELLKDPAIKMVSADQNGQWETIAHVNGEQEANFDFKVIDEQYLPLMKIPVVKGRNFASEMLSDSADGVMVNETFVKTYGWKEPIGQTVDFWYNQKKFKVVGVYVHSEAKEGRDAGGPAEDPRSLLVPGHGDHAAPFHEAWRSA